MSQVNSYRVDPERPIFVVDSGRDALLYAPGHVTRISATDLPTFISALGNESRVGRLARLARDMRGAADEAQRALEARLLAPFAPECLLLYLSARCNLSCVYCYTRPARHRTGARLSEDAVDAGAREVVGHCHRKGRPLTLALHGGGEPTVHLDLIKQIVLRTRAIAEDAGTGWTGYIATNGVLHEDEARWLAREIRNVGLSCDGPPDIQDRLRPSPPSGRSSIAVERTARVVREEGGQLTVRATVVPDTVQRLPEIVSYASHTLGCTRVRVEPVYVVGSASPFRPEDADIFAEQFLRAGRVAQSAGVVLSYAGVRLDEGHGPHCSAARNVLHLLPDGTVSACFFYVDGPSCAGDGKDLGRYRGETGEIAIDFRRADEWRRRVGEIPQGCRGCVAQLHCARECPETCAATPGAGPQDGFRCRLARLLTEAWIRDCAAMLPPPLAPSTERPGRSSTATVTAGGDGDALGELLSELPSADDRDVVRCLADKAAGYRPFTAHALPVPVWARRGYEQAGSRAWRLLAEMEARQSDPLSVYLHVPFCESRCAFCDCYSVASPRVRRSRHERPFVTALLSEVAAWGSLPVVHGRPITTVHFGGGTPGHLEHSDFDEVVGRLRGALSVQPDTEWAIESTSRLLTAGELARLCRLGFRRLHVGVQTLEDGVRQRIGRQGDAQTVVARLRAAAACEMIVTVDLIYGLPGQTVSGWMETVRRLVESGIHGVSLYQLQRSGRNRRFLERSGRTSSETSREFVLFAGAEQLLLRAGFGKNHFAHFARGADQNLYYRHLCRGEDLLALGPRADGVFGDYHYRHVDLAQYRADVDGSWLEGGIRETAAEMQLRPVMTQLLSGAIVGGALQAIGAEELVDGWLDHGLLRRCAQADAYELTASGSWFVREMMLDIEEAAGGALTASGR
jgi:radical SAM protein with 4Fe4S-binding SPASM domain